VLKKQGGTKPFRQIPSGKNLTFSRITERHGLHLDTAGERPSEEQTDHDH
jgi:hypothetical protein